MRAYASVSARFWLGATGRRLRAAGPEAQLVALYLLTSPHANMLGLYYLPKVYVAHETGLSQEAADKGFMACIEADFCRYDIDTEMVFIPNAARFQIAESLVATDKRVPGIIADLTKIPRSRLVSEFVDLYRDRFSIDVAKLPDDLLSDAPSKPLASPFEGASEAPSKPGAGAGAGTGAGARQEQERPNTPSRASTAGYTRLPDDWQLPADWREFCRTCRPDLNPDVVAAKFAAHWHGEAGRAGTKKNWQRTWQNWVEAERAQAKSDRPAILSGDTKPAWALAAGFVNSFEAQNAGCFSHNADEFRDGKRIAEATA